MKIDAKFQQVPDAKKRAAGQVRLQLVVAIDATPSEAKRLADIGYVNSRTPFPAKLFHYPDKMIVTGATGCSTVLGQEDRVIEAFVRALMPIRSWSQDALLRFVIPGKTTYGFINRADQPKVAKWLDEELQALADTLRKHVEHARAESAEASFAAVSKTADLPNHASAPSAPSPRPLLNVKVNRIVMFADED